MEQPAPGRGLLDRLVDAIRLRLRNGGAVRIKACHLVVGIDIDGIKRVLGMWIEANEGPDSGCR